jgi:exopolysaccharide biosynthesis polyprenyl glycosylphosphotransferase
MRHKLVGDSADGLSGQPVVADPSATALSRSGATGGAVPRPRSPERTAAGPGGAPAPAGAAPYVEVAAPVRSHTVATVVIPEAGGSTARRMRPLRAWMLSLPVDFVAAAIPAFWFTAYWKGILAMAALTVLLYATGGHYRGRRHLSFLDELPSLAGRLLTASAVVAVVFAERHDSVANVGSFMRSVSIAVLLVLVGRLVTRNIVLVARRRKWASHGALVIGHGPVAVEIARVLRRHPQYGLRFAGFVDEIPPEDASIAGSWAGDLESLELLIAATETDVVILADTTVAEDRLMEIVRRPLAMEADLLIVPRMHDFHTQTGAPDHIGAIPIMRIRRPTLTGPRWAVKRTFDIVFAVIALTVLSPILVCCAIAVRLEGGPGIFFRQPRIGRSGSTFNVVKFRSMRPRDEQDSATTWSVARDPRVGPVGRFLRRTSLDELPQLWNILVGDMTLVGPRPERPYFVEQFSAEYRNYAHRHRVPAGLTGLAQVSGLRGDTPISDRARFDNYYIENWTIWLDIKVILRTIGEVLRGGGR